MRKHEENKLTMYKSVLTDLDSNKSKTDTVAAFAEPIMEFRTTVQAIESKTSQMDNAITGKTSTKLKAEDELIRVLLPIAAALYTYGRKQNNAEISEKVKVQESYLRRMRDTELVIKARSIHALAVANVGSLGDYGITDVKVDDLSDKIENYNTSLGQRESGTAVRSGARLSLTELFAKADDILENSLDPLMELLRETFTEFYNEYFAARVIKDLGIVHEPEPPPTPPTP
jgi:hypothetical protein